MTRPMSVAALRRLMAAPTVDSPDDDRRRARAALVRGGFVPGPAIGVFRGPDHVLDNANAAWLAACRNPDAIGLPLRDALPDEPLVERTMDQVYATRQIRALRIMGGTLTLLPLFRDGAICGVASHLS